MFTARFRPGGAAHLGQDLVEGGVVGHHVNCRWLGRSERRRRSGSRTWSTSA